MNARTFILLSCFAGVSILAQGFINLGFEAATITLPSVPPGQSGGNVAASAAFPGWQVYYGVSNSAVNTVQHNNQNAGTVNASIFGPQTIVPVFAGNCMAFLQSGLGGSNGTLTVSTVSLVQVGMVPSDAQSLQFLAGNFAPPSASMNFGVFLNGQNLPLFPLQASTDHTLYGVPISGLAGQMAELRFTVFAPSGGQFNNVAVDAFQFSTVPVPEPSTWALFAMGSAFLYGIARRWRK